MEIKLKALAIIRRNNEILAILGKDTHTGEDFYRVCGGTIEFQETSIDALHREIKEELNSGLENVKLYTIKENVFTHNTKHGHEVDFIYEADLSDKTLYEQEHIEVVEPYGTFYTDWVPLEKIKTEEVKIYPNIQY